MNSADIKEFLLGMEKSKLAHEIFIFGECKTHAALPVLELYLDDERVNHHALHKGMTISYLARGAIEKIQDEGSD
jgi:hypothetical protein